MSRYAAYNAIYDEQDYHHEAETPAEVAARRTRRRRRHGKKQGSADGNMPGVGQSEDYRGRWMPPPSATTLTLAQLGIHMAPPARRDDEAASMTLAKLGIHIDPPTMPPSAQRDGSRNVVTWSDLDLIDCISSMPSPGTLDLLHASAPPPPHIGPPPPRPPQPWLNGAAPSLERPCDRILSAPSPQIALHMAEQMSAVHYPSEQMPNYPVAPPRPIQSQPATWSDLEPDPSLRHWLCSGQYGAQPIFNSPLGSNGGMPLASAPRPHPAAPAPPEKAPTSPVATKVAAKLAAEDKLRAETKAEAVRLETLLRHLAAEAYQD